LLNDFSKFFGGVKVTNPRKFFATWHLDLGAGNILKIDEEALGIFPYRNENNNV